MMQLQQRVDQPLLIPWPVKQKRLVYVECAHAAACVLQAAVKLLPVEVEWLNSESSLLYCCCKPYWAYMCCSSTVNHQLISVEIELLVTLTAGYAVNVGWQMLLLASFTAAMLSACTGGASNCGGGGSANCCGVWSLVHQWLS